MIAEMENRQVGANYVVFRSEAQAENRIGIYARGGCHLRAMFATASFIQQVFKGTCCIFHDGDAPRCRSDLELQTLENLPGEWVGTVIEKLQLGADYFQPRLFEELVTIPAAADGAQTFAKNVIVLHIGMDSGGRVLYRHRKHGFLVDPGGGWLQSMDSILNDLSVVKWFRENFESIGMISVDDFVANFTKIIRILRSRMNPRILVFNTLAVEPGSRTHNYQLVKNPPSMRWRQFNVALWDLSRQLDFAVVDLDRVLKTVGIRTQTQFAHFLPRQNLFVGQEAFRVMQELGVFD